MSGMQLSVDMVEDVIKAIMQHDQRADDHGIAMQYMAAINGFLLGHQDFNDQQREEFLETLNKFSQQVCADIVKQRSATPVAPPHPQGAAYGVWKPGDQ
jgi:hypothetical protein